MFENFQFKEFASATRSASPWAKLKNYFRKLFLKNSRTEEEKIPDSVPELNTQEIVRKFKILAPSVKTLAILQFGTTFLSEETTTEPDLLQLLKNLKLAEAGTPSADFAVAEITQPFQGFLVRSREFLYALYEGDEIMKAGMTPLVAGYLARAIAEDDVQNPKIIYFESAQ